MKSIAAKKSYDFALKILYVYEKLIKQQQYDLARQLLKSGTSIGANIEEALGYQSQKDFQSKLSISYKEARETKYWIRLLTDTKYISIIDSQILLQDIEELLKILGKTLITLKNKP